MEYFFIHEYKGVTYYIPTQRLTAEQKHRNKILYGTEYGINKMILRGPGEDSYFVELISDSVKGFYIKDGIVQEA